MTLADLTIETGHFYRKDLNPEALQETFARIALSPWLARPVVNLRETPPTRSTALLFDDYHERPDKKSNPVDLINMILGAAASAGVRIDYIAREAACTALAPATSKLLEASPLFKTDGSSRWLISPRARTIQRSAMSGLPEPTPRPKTMAERIASSVKLDIEFWSEPGPDNNHREWACPLLAAIWQTVRHGDLEVLGGAEAMDDPMGFNHPYVVEGSLPEWRSWDEMPALLQLRPDAAPFTAKEVVSILPADFLGVECAVEIIRENLPGVRNDRIARQMDSH